MYPRKFAVIVTPLLAGGFLALAAPAAHAETGLTVVDCYNQQGQDVKETIAVDPIAGGTRSFSCPTSTTNAQVANDGDQTMQLNYNGLRTNIEPSGHANVHVSVGSDDMSVMYQPGL
jgi:hypothetical protein